MAGPCALDDISKCFVGSKRVSPADIILHMTERQQTYFDELKNDFDDLWGRELQLIDCQKLFCEISKYARIALPEIGGISGRSHTHQAKMSLQRPVEHALASAEMEDQWQD